MEEKKVVMVVVNGKHQRKGEGVFVCMWTIGTEVLVREHLV